MLPEALGELKRSGIEATSGQAMGIGGSAAKATYSAGDRRVELSITDSGGLAGLASMAGWANMTMDKEADGKVEKVYKSGARTIHEEYRKDGSQGEMTVILANGLIVAAEGDRVDIGSLKKVIDGVDLGPPRVAEARGQVAALARRQTSRRADDADRTALHRRGGPREALRARRRGVLRVAADAVSVAIKKLEEELDVQASSSAARAR